MSHPSIQYRDVVSLHGKKENKKTTFGDLGPEGLTSGLGLVVVGMLNLRTHRDIPPLPPAN